VTAVLSEPALDAQVSVRGEPLAGFPVEPNTTAEAGGSTVLWLGPDEWLVVGAREEDYPGAAAVVDVSANRVCFELVGNDVEDVLAQGCSLDLHPSVFAPGRCAQTLLAKAQVILHRTEHETFRIFVRPSFAPYLRAWLEDALTSPRSTLRRR
jgi:sarcosine oxidase subunit gamma